jgi:hypothetical protein
MAALARLLLSLRDRVGDDKPMSPERAEGAAAASSSEDAPEPHAGD